MISQYLFLIFKKTTIRRLGFLFLLFLFCGKSFYSQDSVRIYGCVTDFNGNPLDSVSVIVKNKMFEDVYETISDKMGKFSLRVPKGFYYCIYAIKLPEYGKSKLEYWAWNIPAFNDLEINPKYERMEIYGMNAFEPQVGPFETYMVYFRPMSLKKVLESQAFLMNKDTIDVAPKSISKDELTVYVNNFLADVVCINKVIEYARGKYIYGYLVQIRKPKESKNSELEYDKISVLLHSKETNEYGMGECFVKKLK